jgi:hypothetical protein
MACGKQEALTRCAAGACAAIGGDAGADGDDSRVRGSTGRSTISTVRLVAWIPPLFRDRAAAGRALSEAVAELELDEPVVIGVARGGVAVAVEVARVLELC